MQGNIKKLSDRIRVSYFQSHSRFIHTTVVMGLMNILLGISKVVSGVLSLSVFACMNGLYTLGMVIARYSALVGYFHKQEKKSWFYYQLTAVIMIVASLLYIAYSLWMMWHPRFVYYDKVIAISIATITFTEVGINLYGVLSQRKGKTPVVHILKTISLATSLISMVLTQSAILSFADEVYNPSVNGLLGCVMGVLAVCLGVYLICRIRRLKRLHYND